MVAVLDKSLFHILFVIPILVEAKISCQSGVQTGEGFFGFPSQFIEVQCTSAFTRCSRADIHFITEGNKSLFSVGNCMMESNCTNVCNDAISRKSQAIASMGGIISGCDEACCATSNCNRQTAVEINDENSAAALSSFLLPHAGMVLFFVALYV